MVRVACEPQRLTRYKKIIIDFLPFILKTLIYKHFLIGLWEIYIILTNYNSHTIDKNMLVYNKTCNNKKRLYMADKCIHEGIASQRPYKEIYSTCKDRLKIIQIWGALAVAS